MSPGGSGWGRKSDIYAQLMNAQRGKIQETVASLGRGGAAVVEGEKEEKAERLRRKRPRGNAEA